MSVMHLFNFKKMTSRVALTTDRWYFDEKRVTVSLVTSNIIAINVGKASEGV